MNGILTITLNGKPERVQFNQFANAELAKHLIPKDLQSSITQVEVLRAVVERAKDNLPALIKLVVYAGILGDSLVYGFEPRLSIEQVGQYIGNADDNEIYRIWGAFLQVQSVDEKEEEGQKKKGDSKPLTRNEELAYAFGEMGLTPHEYYSMTRQEFLLRCKGFYRKELKEWQHTRKIAWQIYASQPFAKKKPQPMQKWMPLEGDKKAELDLDQIKKEWDSFKNSK